MKKNLTFLMMLMAFVGIASAQIGPKFNYSAVVRHHITEYQGEEVDMDTLYHNNLVNITLAVKENGVVIYSESFPEKMTDDNGFVSVVFGEQALEMEVGEPYGTSGRPTQIDLGGNNQYFQPADGINFNPTFRRFDRIDWSTADSIEATFELVNAGNAIVTFGMPIQPVPFALWAGATPLTTEAITAYLSVVPTNEAKQVLDAFNENTNLKEAIEDAIEEYLISEDGYAIVLNVAKWYLTQYIDENEAKDYYDAFKENTDLTAAVKALVKDYVMNNKAQVKKWVTPVVLYCLQNTNMQDVRDFYDALQEIPATERQEIKQVVRNYLDEYVHSTDFNAMISANQGAIAAELTDIIASISKEEALAAWGWVEMYNVPVKNAMRTKLNTYIDAYKNNKMNVTSVANTKKSNLIITPTCTIDYCQLEQLFEAWAATHNTVNNGQ